MKVMQIMPEFGLAGAEIMCENLMYELVELGIEVVAISLYDFHSPITERLESNGIKVLYLNKKPGLDFSIIRKLKKVFKVEKPDVIHTHRYVMQYSIPAAIFSKIKHRVHTIHNIAKKENTKIARILNKLFYKFAHVVPVALSEEIKKTVIKEYHLKEKNVPVILNGINLQKYSQKKDYNLHNPIKIIHVGRFSEQKNHIGLVWAFYNLHKEIPNTTLELVGDGEKKESISSLVEQLGLKDSVHFLGLNSNVGALLFDSDIFVLPSLYEGIPMTIIEAMATGLPIIATNVGGLSDMITSYENGILISAPEDLKNACLTLINNKELRERIGMNAFVSSNAFSSKTMALKYSEIYGK